MQAVSLRRITDITELKEVLNNCSYSASWNRQGLVDILAEII